MFPEWEHQTLLIYNKENLEQCSQSTPTEDGKFGFNDTMTSLSEKLSLSVIKSASENENQNLSSSDNETLPDSPIKQKCKRRCIQLLYAKECSGEEPPESFERKLDTFDTGRNNEANDTENFFEKAEEDIQSDSKKKATMFYPLLLLKVMMSKTKSYN